jgi:hypothetical protein
VDSITSSIHYTEWRQEQSGDIMQSGDSKRVDKLQSGDSIRNRDSHIVDTLYSGGSVQSGDTIRSGDSIQSEWSHCTV